MSKRLPSRVKNLLEKAEESALLAVDVYNKPRTAFRSGGFVVLMCVAWTSLLHAIFEMREVKYFYKQQGSRRYQMIDGDRKTWELQKCIEEYFEQNDPRRANIEFFFKIRNKIEHRFMPSLDSEITGECQALLLNFEEIIVKEFGQSHSLIDALFIPLQFTEHKRNLPKSNDEKKILKFIETFRKSLSQEIEQSQQFAFKAYFVPKLGNHRSSSDIAIEYIKYDPENPTEMQKYEKVMVGIKEKQVPVANIGKYRPKAVLQELQKRGYNKTIDWHTQMWKKHKVRPPANSGDKYKCQTQYCQFDVSSTTKDYVFTDDWIEFLIKNELQSKAAEIKQVTERAALKNIDAVKSEKSKISLSQAASLK